MPNVAAWSRVSPPCPVADVKSPELVSDAHCLAGRTSLAGHKVLLNGVGARNSVVAGQAAFRYSLMSPSHRVDLMTRAWAGSRSTLVCGSIPNGGR